MPAARFEAALLCARLRSALHAFGREVRRGLARRVARVGLGRRLCRSPGGSWLLEGLTRSCLSSGNRPERSATLLPEALAALRPAGLFRKLLRPTSVCPVRSPKGLGPAGG